MCVKHEYSLEVSFTNKHHRERPRKTIPAIQVDLRKQSHQTLRKDAEDRVFLPATIAIKTLQNPVRSGMC